MGKYTRVEGFVVSKENLIWAQREMNSGNDIMNSKVVNIIPHDKDNYLILVEHDGYPYMESKWHAGQFYKYRTPKGVDEKE